MERSMYIFFYFPPMHCYLRKKKRKKTAQKTKVDTVHPDEGTNFPFSPLESVCRETFHGFYNSLCFTYNRNNETTIAIFFLPLF